MNKKIIGIFVITLLIGASMVSISASENDKNNFTNILDLNDGLIAYWSFDDCTAVDNANNGYTGRIQGNPECVEGKVNKGLKFDGLGDYISIEKLPSGNSGSLSFWVNSGRNVLNQKAIFSVSHNSRPCRMLFDIRNKRFQTNNKPTTGSTQDGCQAEMGYILPNTWYHVVWISDGSKYYGYIDGEAQTLNILYGINDGDWFGDLENPSYFRIGNMKYLLDYPYHIPFEGIIDDVRLYDKILSQEEINELFAMGNGNQPPNKPEKPTGLTSGKPDTEYTFSTSSIDPDRDTISYLWDWGDGNFSGWLGPYISGAIVEESHSWADEGTYDIKVKCRDLLVESEWSDPLIVSMPKTKSISEFNPWLMRIIQRFPILEYLL
ncbi:LamG-like jellyroll fold domain-containing protein [Thermoplasmatota archaeon]